MISINILTIMFVLAVFNILTAVFFMMYIRLTQVKINLKYFILSKTLQGLSWLLRLLIYNAPILWIMDIADLMLVFGFAMESILFVLFREKVSKTLKYFYFISLGFISASVFIFSQTAPEIKNLFLLTGYITNMYIISWKMVMPSDSTRFQKLIGISYGTLPLISSIMYISITKEVTMVGETTSLIGILYYISILFMQLIGGVGYLLIVNERDENNLREFAVKDSLTGILNRRAFYDYATLLLHRSVRESSPITLIMIDVDHFKVINDTYGHLRGDRILKFLCDHLSLEMRKDDLFARFGGEEFLIMLYNADEKEATSFTNRLNSGIQKAISSNKDEIAAFTVSMGVCSLVPSSINDLDTMIKHSDDALYHSKNNGRNQATLLRKVDEELCYERL